MYIVPKNYFYRIHHIRPRFKNDVENVLFYLASELSRMEPEEHSLFSSKFNEAIKLFPGNNSKAIKTINNWRTEISSLFGFIERKGNKSKPSRLASILNKNQDLVEFFRFFLYKFQYPGGHLKNYEILDSILNKVRFRPVPYILAVMLEGQKRMSDGQTFGITKAEATHCIFNDLRVTTGESTPTKTVELILTNRANHREYDWSGDTIRYAGDIMDYMVLANLAKQKANNHFYANTTDLEAIQTFIDSIDEFFEPYKALYNIKDLTVESVNDLQEAWFNYVNEDLDTLDFKTNILSLIEEFEETEGVKDSEFIHSVLNTIQNRIKTESKIKTKEIGDLGESITIEHEKIRLKNLYREDLLHLIKKIPETFAVGYDISSYEGIGDIRRYIEVKTTISRNKLHINSFNMTTSEWSAANSVESNYYIYRIMVSSGGITLFIIKDPVQKYKDGLIGMIPRNGAHITFNEDSGHVEELLA